MTDQNANQESIPGSKHDRFLPVTIRRSRFTAGIVLSGLLFWHVGWFIAGPAAPHQTFSLMGWGANPIIPAVGLLFLLIIAAVAAMAITHADTPHAGQFCALLGLGALAIRGGTIYPLLRIADDATTIHSVYQTLAQECAIWAAILVLAELVTARIHAKFFANTLWMERVAQDPEAFRMGLLTHLSPGAAGLAGDMARAQAEKLKKGAAKPMNAVLANVLALLLGCLVASLLLPVFMQSQGKGQVLFAAFISFGLAGFLANLVLAQSNAWPILLCVPITAALGYFRAKGALDYPGFSATSYARSLPIDYIAAGVPGALYGYYGSVRLRLSHLFEPDDQ